MTIYKRNLKYDIYCKYLRSVRKIPLLVALSVGIVFRGFTNDHYNIRRANTPVKVDGVLDDQAWIEAQTITDFTQYFPTDTVDAISGNEIMFTYDDQYLYFGAKLYNLNDERTYVTPSLRRDYRGNIDGVTLILDPFQDNTNGFQFGINAYGVQREALISSGGQRGGDNLSLSWDNKWIAEAKQYEGYWIAEAAIPFKTLRYTEGSDRWNINVYRIDTEVGERSTWSPIPRQFHILNMAFMRELVWDKPLGKPGPNISLIPYVSGSGSQDFEEGQDEIKLDRSMGLDAKIAVTPGLNLDLTLNPDFSQVELDEQVTNLDRFELFFPEKRQFFLENDDLFSDAGHPFLAKPFFSRRIGIARDTSTGVNLQNKIHYGARLSGKINDDWRIGVLNMQEAKITAINKPGINYSVATLQRKMFKRSNISGIFVNKQPINSSIENDSVDAPSYNRVIGLDYKLASADAKWYGIFFFHKSIDDNPEPEEFASLAFISYNSNTWNFSWANVFVGENYDAQAGFVPRPGILRIQPDIGYTFFPKGGFFNNHIVKYETEFIWKDNRISDQSHSITYESGLTNTGEIKASVNQQYIYLFESFDPSNTDGEELAAGTDYVYRNLQFNYKSDERKTFFYEIGGYFGEYFNGERYNLIAEAGFRSQPYAAVSLNASYNKLIMPAPLSDANLWLIGSRLDVTFTKSLFLTSFLQYNSQIRNTNINTRFQWRFKPVSDLFIVYTDNYGTNNFDDLGFRKKNRAIVLKMTYWFNL